MYRDMIQAMERQTGDAFRETGSATSLWMHEWSRMVLRAFEPDRKVVFVSAYAFPMELLAACDVVPFDFELASAMIGTTKMGVPTMIECEENGYSQDVCSFHRIALGASQRDYFPRPDLLITTSFYCDGKAKANEILSILYRKQAMLLQVPAQISGDAVRYVERQLRAIADEIAKTAGQSFDRDRLKEAVRSSNRARRSQQRMLELLKHRPAPWGGRELISFSINSLWLSASDVKERLNEAFVAQMERAIAADRSGPERHRIYWFAWIPTYPSNLFEILAEHQVSVPLCENFRVSWDEIDAENPFEGLALKCLKNPFVGAGARRTEDLDRIAAEYAIDGALLFATPACRHSKSTHRILRDRLMGLGVPLLTLDMDISDPRGFSPEQTRSRLEEFIEILDQRES
ncbi:MAG: 2-hydroxyacyl-CoA dehydratase subunit D [Planctomycetota bacterium]|jgi:benzoyl-CoA reductase/2-hydroxyglutaryl-CoA dehydratase subunit BcrC/BadD/HgdB